MYKFVYVKLKKGVYIFVVKYFVNILRKLLKVRQNKQNVEK